MNHEILFRGFHPDEGQSEIYIERVYINGEWVKGKWVYGSHIHRTIYYGSPCDTHIIVEIGEFEYDDYASYEVIPETVGQYIGRNDINGKKIFKGNKVFAFDWLDGVEFEGVVEFDNSSFTIKSDIETHYRWVDYEVEVIGNILTNPELLEGME